MKEIIGTEYITSFKNPKGKTYFVIQKRINNKTCSFGVGNTLIEALMIRDWCKANNWEKRYSRHSTGEKHIRKLNGSYCVQKLINGKCEHFGSFKSLEDAIIERDLLIKYEWDLDCLCDLN